MFGSARVRPFPVKLIVVLNSLLVMVSFPWFALGQTKDTTTLQRAMRDGTVVATFKGTGGSSGDSVEVMVAKTARAGQGRLDLTIPPGSMLHSSNEAEQSMVIMGVEGRSTGGGMFEPTSHITVSATKPVSYILSAFCAEFEKENPSTADTFTLEEPVPILACLAREGKTLSVAAQQAAVWQHTDRMSVGRVNEKFAVSQDDWEAASNALDRCRSEVAASAMTIGAKSESYASSSTLTTHGSGRTIKGQAGIANRTASPQGSDQMQTGVLAIASSETGTLFIDSVEAAVVAPDKIVTLKLLAGQHFVDLRDTGGQKRWEKVITIPAGAQVAEKIDFHATSSSASISRETPEEGTASKIGRPEASKDTTLIENLIEPFQRVLSAGDQSVPFESLRGSFRGNKHWNSAITLPGAKGCSVGIGRPGPVSSGFPEYFCFWEYSNDSDARSNYEHLRGLIQQDGSCTARTSPLDEGDVQSASCERRKQNQMMLYVNQLRQRNIVTLTIAVISIRQPDGKYKIP